MHRRTVAVPAALLLISGLTACGSDDGDGGEEKSSASAASGSISGLEVTGDFGKEATITVDGLDVSEAQSDVVIEGDGAEVGDDTALKYRFAVAKGTDGTEVLSNFTQPEPESLSVAEQPPAIMDAIAGTTIGSRVVLAAPVSDVLGEQGAPQAGLAPEDDVVFVFDLIEEAEEPLAGPEGEEIDPPADAPVVVADGDTVTGLDFSGAASEPSDELQVIPLVEGEGDPIDAGRQRDRELLRRGLRRGPALRQLLRARRAHGLPAHRGRPHRRVGPGPRRRRRRQPRHARHPAGARLRRPGPGRGHPAELDPRLRDRRAGCEPLTMTARKSERLMNLLITLLVSRGYVTKDKLRELIPDYREASSDDAFEKMFERDKDDLRALGIPIEVGGFDAGFDDEHGYRINRDAFELPEISLAPDEAAVLGLAARVWQQAGLAAATSDALLKLRAGGVEIDREALDVVRPQVAPDEPAFEPFWQAVSTRQEVRFGYRKAAATTSEERTLQPWGIVSYRSRWYVVGRDVDRDAPRLFRLSRVSGEVLLLGEPEAFEVPEGTDLRTLTASLAPPPEHRDRTASLRVRPGRAVALRHDRDAEVSEATEDGWDAVRLRFGHLGTTGRDDRVVRPGRGRRRPRRPARRGPRAARRVVRSA